MPDTPKPVAPAIDPKQYKIAKIWVIVSMMVSFMSILALMRGAPEVVPFLGLGLGIATFVGVYLPLTQGRYARTALVGIILGTILVLLNLITVYYLLVPGTIISLIAQSGVLYAGIRARQWNKSA